MKYCLLIMNLGLLATVLAEEVKINVYPTVTYNQRIDITNKNIGDSVPRMSIPTSNPMSTTALATGQLTPVAPNIVLHTDNPIVAYSLLKKCCFSGAIMVACSYFAFLGYLIAQSHILQQNDHWYNWKQEVPLAALRELSNEQIMQALNESLNKKYTNSTKDVFVLVAALHEEEQELKRIIYYCSQIKRYKVNFLFFNKDSVVELAKQKLERLLFIKEIVAKHIIFITGQSATINEGLL
ncbi:MAG: hypothetical protein M1114_05880 [Candidatus Dependentiae bacterium]|nr:hypothetical protein [Candidatus Dependentiae bacterium]